MNPLHKVCRVFNESVCQQVARVSMRALWQVYVGEPFVDTIGLRGMFSLCEFSVPHKVGVVWCVGACVCRTVVLKLLLQTKG